MVRGWGWGLWVTGRILLGVSSVAELGGPDPEVDDDGEGDDLWIELLSVQLVNTHRARLLKQQHKDYETREHMDKVSQSNDLGSVYTNRIYYGLKS